MGKNIAQRMAAWCGVIVVVLLIPLVSNAPWTGSDFALAGIGLFAFALVYELATVRMRKTSHKLVVGVAVLLGILFVIGWAATGP